MQNLTQDHILPVSVRFRAQGRRRQHSTAQNDVAEQEPAEHQHRHDQQCQFP